VWPDGCISLVVVAARGDLIAASVVGPGTRAQQVPLMVGAVYTGLRLWPDRGGWALGVPAASLRDRVGGWADLLGIESLDVARRVAAASPDGASDRVMCEWLASRIAALPVPDRRVRSAVLRLIATGGETPIAGLAREVGMSTRQLQRRFHAAVGLTPKEFARVCRGRAALAASLRGEDRWAVVAATLGFADQAHLANDLKSLMGLTPGSLERRLAMIEHELVES
jgi:AraC-like DNA-binding protein